MKNVHGHLSKLQLSTAEAITHVAKPDHHAHKQMLMKTTAYDMALTVKIGDYASITTTHTIPEPTTAEAIRKQVVADIGFNSILRHSRMKCDRNHTSYWLVLWGDLHPRRTANSHKK